MQLDEPVILSMRNNPMGSRFDEYCVRVDLTVNTNILGCTACNIRNGQWQVPFNKKDSKKIGDVRLSGSVATKFMTGLEYLVEECTSDY